MNYQHVLTHQKVKQQRDELLAACKSVVYTWEHDFKGQSTGYEGTPLEEVYRQCRAAIARAEHSEGKITTKGT